MKHLFCFYVANTYEQPESIAKSAKKKKSFTYVLIRFEMTQKSLNSGKCDRSFL